MSKDIGAENRVPLIVEKCQGLFWLVDDVLLSINDEVCRLILLFVFKVMENVSASMRCRVLDSVLPPLNPRSTQLKVILFEGLVSPLLGEKASTSVGMPKWAQQTGEANKSLQLTSGFASSRKCDK